MLALAPASHPRVCVVLTMFVMVVVAARLQTPGFFQKYCIANPTRPRFAVVVLGRRFVSLCGFGCCRRYGFLTDGYSHNFFWWEVVVLARRVFVLVVPSFVKNAFLQVCDAALELSSCSLSLMRGVRCSL